jgi:hypothetical protein
VVATLDQRTDRLARNPDGDRIGDVHLQDRVAAQVDGEHDVHQLALGVRVRPAQAALAHLRPQLGERRRDGRRIADGGEVVGRPPGGPVDALGALRHAVVVLPLVRADRVGRGRPGEAAVASHVPGIVVPGQ